MLRAFHSADFKFAASVLVEEAAASAAAAAAASHRASKRGREILSSGPQHRRQLHATNAKWHIAHPWRRGRGGGRDVRAEGVARDWICKRTFSPLLSGPTVATEAFESSRSIQAAD